jgi:hypothetical protein
MCPCHCIIHLEGCMRRGCCRGNGGFQLCVVADCSTLSLSRAAASRSTQHLRALASIIPCEGGSRSGGHAAVPARLAAPRAHKSIDRAASKRQGRTALNRVPRIVKPCQSQSWVRSVCALVAVQTFTTSIRHRSPARNAARCSKRCRRVRGGVPMRAPVREVQPLGTQTDEVPPTSLKKPCIGGFR